MDRDFLQTLEYAGFTARVKRLSDQLLYNARKVYKQLESDIEPNWHLVFLLLKKEDKLTVTEIGHELRFSHPAVIKIINKMKRNGYVSSSMDPKDNRKQLLQLTQKAKEQLPKLEQRWDQIQTVIQGFVSEELMVELEQIEHKLNEQSLFERFKNQLKYDEDENS